MTQLRQTHTFALLKVSAAAYDEIRELLEAAGYSHAFREDGAIDMHGVGLGRGDERDDDPAIAWGVDPAVTRDMLLIAVELKVDDDELLGVCRVWTQEQREAAERWAGALHRRNGDDRVTVPPEPAHVTVLRTHPQHALSRGLLGVSDDEHWEAKHSGG